VAPARCIGILRTRCEPVDTIDQRIDLRRNAPQWRKSSSRSVGRSVGRLVRGNWNGIRDIECFAQEHNAGIESGLRNWHNSATGDLSRFYGITGKRGSVNSEWSGRSLVGELEIAEKRTRMRGRILRERARIKSRSERSERWISANRALHLEICLSGSSGSADRVRSSAGPSERPVGRKVARHGLST